MVTITYIFDEVVTFFSIQNFHFKAVEVGIILLKNSDIELIEIAKNLFSQGWQYFKRHQDKSYSFTDCLSFVVMQEREIVTALTLDHHFVQAGFQICPS
ncbi:type II toxin-antitoxin system VapC family toxin [Phormidium pseudopriestleyi]|uniref:type II toxin-antitoxin system VapC family toxin n=1 Tax=Phormidium pseudopriestleyi TaxID=1759527 RepID=UPI0030F400A2